MKGLVHYQVLVKGSSFDFQRQERLYSYLVGANGVFVAGKNEFFRAIIPVQVMRDPKSYIRGLEMIKPIFFLEDRVPNYLLHRMVSISRKAVPNEVLFYLNYENISQNVWVTLGKEWTLSIPLQSFTPASVTPLEDKKYVPLEVHSHNTMPAFFSETDNRDETGMRLYGVLGRVDQEAVDIKLRVSIYGHYAPIPYHYVFNPHPGVRDAKD